MSYPARSDWTSAQPEAAWFVDQTSGRAARVCQTTAWSFLSDLQETLRERLALTGPLPTFDGTIGAAAVPVDPALGAWPLTLAALYAVAVADRAPAAYLAGVDQAWRTRAWTRPALQTALWVTYLNQAYAPDFDATGAYTYGHGHPGEAGLPADVVLPVALGAPPRPTTAGSAGLTCGVVPGAERLVTPPEVGAAAPFNVWPALGLAGAAFLGVSLVSTALSRKAPPR